MNIPLIVIVGETASGKSGLAMEIAKKFDGEIIAADSRTVYKGLDIGTAKPSKADQSAIKHHGIDLVDPTETYSAGRFKTYANEVIKEIKSKNNLPIMVGGTGLYVDGVLFDYSFGPPEDAEKRKDLNNTSLEQLQKMAQKLDIFVDYQTLQNKRHLIRLIERGGETQNIKEQPVNTLIVGLKPTRSRLRNNIEARVEHMFKSGLRREVERLKHLGWDSEAMSGIGYREFEDFYANKISMAKVKKNVVQSTLNLAKRQRTWFKRNPYIEWFETAEDAQKRVAEYLSTSDYTNK